MSRSPDPARRELWRSRMERFHRSNLTVVEFCQRERVSTPSLYQWRKKLEDDDTPPGQRLLPASPRFAPVVLAESLHRAVPTLRLPGGASIELPATLERERLADSSPLASPRRPVGLPGRHHSDSPGFGRCANHHRLPTADRQQRHGMRSPSLTIGRKNWLFAGSPVAEEVAATMYTLFTSASRHHLDQGAYRNDLLRRLAGGETDLDSLLPDRWAESHPASIRTYRQADQVARREQAKQCRARRRKLTTRR